MTVNCYGCDDPITKENSSNEHIINNILGGRLKSKSLLCKVCNSKFGDSIDKEFDRQLGNIVDLLGIDKERPKPRVKIGLLTIDGKKKYVGKGMKPHDKITIDITGKDKIEITTDNKKDFEKSKKEKIRDLENKYSLKYSEYQEQPTNDKLYISNYLSKDKPGEIAFGGPVYFRAVAKIALNYFLYRGYNKELCKQLTLFVKGVNKSSKVVNYYYPSHYKIHNLGKEEVSHIIHIRGDTECKVLFAYIELLNFENFIIILDNNYIGGEINDTYCFDLFRGEKIPKKVKIDISCHHFENLHVIAKSHEKNHEKMFQRIEKMIEKRQLN